MYNININFYFIMLTIYNYVKKEKYQLYVISGKLGIRHLQVFLHFLGMVIGYSLRVSMSVAIVPMTQNDSNSYQFEVTCILNHIIIYDLNFS